MVLKTPEILEPVGITQEKFFAKALGYDETGLWVQFPDFELPVRVGEEWLGTNEASSPRTNCFVPFCSTVRTAQPASSGRRTVYMKSRLSSTPFRSSSGPSYSSAINP